MQLDTVTQVWSNKEQNKTIHLLIAATGVVPTNIEDGIAQCSSTRIATKIHDRNILLNLKYSLTI